MTSHMKEILDAIQSPDTTSADFAALPLPESYRAITVHKDETEMFAGLETRVRESTDAATTEIYEQAMPPDQLYQGLERYWRKKAE